MSKMSIPIIDSQDIILAIPGITNVRYMAHGGQKSVYSCAYNGKPYVIKFILVEDSNGGSSTQVDILGSDISMPEQDAIASRAKREVETMAACNVPTLVKLGPIGLNTAVIKGQKLLFFTEDKIDGLSLKEILNSQKMLDVQDVKGLGIDIGQAIEEIWKIERVHRDIKPGNIMMRSDNKRFVLLDPGLVLDLNDISLTPTGYTVGTPSYYSPEQLTFKGKRQLDFRSDLFSLGIVMYQSSTGLHPFFNSSTKSWVEAISTFNPPSPKSIRSEIPVELDQIIMRVLSKQPHLRYRTCKQFIDQLNRI